MTVSSIFATSIHRRISRTERTTRKISAWRWKKSYPASMSFLQSIIIPQTKPAFRSPCGNPPHGHTYVFALDRSARGFIAQIQWSRLKRNHGSCFLGGMRDRMGQDDQVSPAPLPKLLRVLPGLALWPMPLFPEVCQHVEQKNDAQAI